MGNHCLKSDNRYKKYLFLTSFLPITVSLLLLVGDCLQKDKLFSDTENRVLAQKPKFTVQDFLNGSFASDYEEYVTDQFVFRDGWIWIKTSFATVLGQQEINGVYLGKDDYLIERHMPEKYGEALIQTRVKSLKKLVDRYRAKVMLVPTADNVLSEKLPDHAPYFRQDIFLQKVKESVGENAYIDAFTVLTEHKSEEIYYRTDHHWNSLGAKYGYQTLVKTYGMVPKSYEKKTVVSVCFLGTLYNKINRKVRCDTIFIYDETNDVPVTVTYDLRQKKDSVYEEKWLSGKNQYGYFLDDNHAFTEIETKARTGKELFLIKDSYANCLVPFLLAHYDKIYLLDLRYFNGRLYSFLDRYYTDGTTDLIILYNCIHFLENFVYS